MATFYEGIGEFPLAKEYWEKADRIANRRNPDITSADFEYPFFLLRQGEFESAMEKSQGGIVFVLPHVMAMLGMQDRDPKHYLDERRDQNPKAKEPRLMLVAARYLCGDTQSAQSLARQFIELDNDGALQTESQEALDIVLKYYAGDDEPPQRFLYLSADSPEPELPASVFVALRLIGKGEPVSRAEARRLAQHASENSGTYFTYTLSRTLLTLLDDDDWPRIERGFL